MDITRKTTFVYNGKEYPTEVLAMEAKLMIENRVSAFIGASKYDHRDKAIWVIKDEGDIDGGYTSNRGPSVLAYVEGTFENAVKYAFTIRGFVGYGPGTIERLDIVKV